MELEVQHENQTIILWLRSGCRTDLSLLYELGKTWRYRAVVIRSGFGSLINNSSFESFSKAIAEYIDYYNNTRIQAKTKWMPPSKFREASMMEA